MRLASPSLLINTSDNSHLKYSLPLQRKKRDTSETQIRRARVCQQSSLRCGITLPLQSTPPTSLLGNLRCQAQTDYPLSTLAAIHLAAPRPRGSLCQSSQPRPPNKQHPPFTAYLATYRHPQTHHRAGSSHQTTHKLSSHHTASHRIANMANMDIDFTRRNKKPRLLTDSERDKLDEFVDSIHYSSR